MTGSQIPNMLRADYTEDEGYVSMDDMADPLDFDQVEFVLVVMLIELDWRDVVEFGGFVVLVPILVVLAQCLAEHQPFQVAGRVEQVVDQWVRLVGQVEEVVDLGEIVGLAEIADSVAVSFPFVKLSLIS